jgi:hypothetical protein
MDSRSQFLLKSIGGIWQRIVQNIPGTPYGLDIIPRLQERPAAAGFPSGAKTNKSCLGRMFQLFFYRYFGMRA